jgi:hypothetical protein
MQPRLGKYFEYLASEELEIALKSVKLLRSLAILIDPPGNLPQKPFVLDGAKLSDGAGGIIDGNPLPNSFKDIWCGSFNSLLMPNDIFTNAENNSGFITVAPFHCMWARQGQLFLSCREIRTFRPRRHRGPLRKPIQSQQVKHGVQPVYQRLYVQSVVFILGRAVGATEANYDQTTGRP